MSNVCLIIYTIDLPIYYKHQILNLRIIIVSIHIDNFIERKSIIVSKIFIKKLKFYFICIILTAVMFSTKINVVMFIQLK